MKKPIFLLILIWACYSYAQNDDVLVPKLENLFSANINVIGTGFTYERVVSEKITTHFNASYQLVGLSSGSSDDEDIDLTFAGNFSVAGRYYYNRERRFTKGKKLTQNAGNYLAAEFQVVPDFLINTEEQFVRYLTTYMIGAKYGLRRNITKNLNYEFEFGAGYIFTERDNIVLPLLEFKLQYVLF